MVLANDEHVLRRGLGEVGAVVRGRDVVGAGWQRRRVTQNGASAVEGGRHDLVTESKSQRRRVDVVTPDGAHARGGVGGAGVGEDALQNRRRRGVCRARTTAVSATKHGARERESGAGDVRLGRRM